MLCGISGQPPETPVVARNSGQIYEERLILEYISENGKDPITGEVLDKDDLIRIKQNPRAAIPRPPELNSIPALLSSLQNEYDAVMLEMSAVKKSYDHIRQELAHALYANDSAHRVIARLLSERDEARAALTSIGSSVGQNGVTNGVDHDASMLEVQEAQPSTSISQSQSFVARINAANESLSSTRKAKMKRKPSSYVSLANFKANTVKTEKRKADVEGDVTSMDVSLDGSECIVGTSTGKVSILTGSVSTLIGEHANLVSHVAFARSVLGVEHGNLDTFAKRQAAVSASKDALIIWGLEGKEFSQRHAVDLDQDGEIAGLVIHPTGELIIVAFKRGDWTLYDIQSGRVLLQIKTEHKFASVDVHPDGTLIAIGTAKGATIVYDLRNGQESAQFVVANDQKVIEDVSFSENGYYLAIATRSEVEILDLRKMKKIHSFASSGSGKACVRFDPSGQFLALTEAEGIAIYANKTWERLAIVKGSALAIRWSWKNGNLFSLNSTTEEENIVEYSYLVDD